MARQDNAVRHFATKPAGAAVDNLDTNIPAGMTVVFKMIDFTAPAQQMAGVKVLVGPTGSPNTVVAAAQGDKVIPVPEGSFIEGPMTVRIQLDNSNNGSPAFLGAVIYYEEV